MPFIKGRIPTVMVNNACYVSARTCHVQHRVSALKEKAGRGDVPEKKPICLLVTTSKAIRSETSSQTLKRLKDWRTAVVN